MNSFLALRSIRKSFDSKEVLTDVSVSVREGEVLALLGPSGSGKTTLLRVIAGFESADGGTVEVDGQDVVRLPPERRRFGMVFQHYALFPHLSVGENVAFGIEVGQLDKSEVSRRVEESLERVDLAGFSTRRIHEISGGQQQRVALARALAPGPRLLLLDEPLSNLDPTLRERTRSELRRVVGEVGITAVWVTHEQEEAFHVGDVVAVLDAGRLQQAGPPAEVYRRPVNRFVAGFVGRASWLRAKPGEGSSAVVEAGGRRDQWSATYPDAEEEIDLLVRPEQLSVGPSDRATGLPGTILGRRFAGSTTLYRIQLSGEDGVVLDAADADPDREVGSGCTVALREGEVAVGFGPEPSV